MDLVEQLNHVFNPKTVVVIGASSNPTKPGFLCVRSLQEAGFKGKIYPVNPNLSEFSGLRVYPSVGAVPDEVDLAIIAVPAQQTISVMKECVAKGIKGVVMVTSGFREVGTQVGSDLHDRIREIANKGRIKIIGPNCMGVVVPRLNLNATFNSMLGSIKAGSVAVASQSGGVCTYIANGLTNSNVGVSKLVSMGNRCNLDFDEIVEYLGEDEETKVITLYIEGLEKPRQLMNIARQVVKRKPIVVYKSGKAEELNQASLSHTGVLAGKYRLYEAAFTHAGIITVGSTMELVDVAKALAFQPPSSGNRVAVISGMAGPGIVLADKCYEFGLRLAQFSTETRQRLRQLISPLNPVDNPVDLGWIRGFTACREVLRLVVEDDGVDMVAISLAYSDTNVQLNQAIVDISKHYRKPIAYAFLRPLEAKAAVEVAEIERNGVPAYPFLERAVAGLAGLFRYGEILRAIE